MTDLLVLLALLILLSGFFSGSEIALFSIGDARVKALERAGQGTAHALAKIKSNPERLLTTILVGNNVVNIAAASIATAIAMESFGREGVAYATGIMTLLVLVFGEIVPKSFAAANAIRISLLVAPVFFFLSRALAPIVIPLEALTRLLLKRRDGPGVPSVTEAEIREMTAIGHREGEIDPHERVLIERVFRLDRTRAWDVMTPRVNIFAWPASRTLEEIGAELPRVQYSRIPVYEENMDRIVGVLYARDAYRALLSGEESRTVREIAREPFLVPGSLPVPRLLEEFRARRIHLGIVMDEYGGTDGLVTLEDILEELVGEIVDETDRERRPLVRLTEEEALVEGRADLREINEMLDTRLPQMEHRSLNGYLLDLLGYVPPPGHVETRDGVTIRVEAATDTQVLRARVRRLETDTDSEGSQAPESTSD